MGEHMFVCPACGRRSLVDHCRSRYCQWHRCLEPDCQLVADLARKSGTRMGRDGGRIRWASAA